GTAFNNGNTMPTTYDPIGRSFTVSARVKSDRTALKANGSVIKHLFRWAGSCDAGVASGRKARTATFRPAFMVRHGAGRAGMRDNRRQFRMSHGYGPAGRISAVSPDRTVPFTPMTKPIASRSREAALQLPPKLASAARYVADHPFDAASMPMRASARQTGEPPTTFTRLARASGFQGWEALRTELI
ncbi:hypothetical protein OY671_009588, partial [Metschnikowia pulcherrima]